MVIADDVVIVRSGVEQLLGAAGVDVVGSAGSTDELLRLVALESPDVAIVDIRMPPTHKDEGLVAARTIREQHPTTAVLVLSQYLKLGYAQRLLEDRPGGLGYLLKERVTDVAVLIDALDRVVAGECVVDPAIVQRLMDEERALSPLAKLTPRERQTLQLMSEGRSNIAIAHRLDIGERTVESLCASVFRKLGLEPDPDVNRRVLAVLAVLGR
ncbi:MAG TPA: response regulator transcription factor [Candidatus Nanopelagicales bacterium]|nr:response regulator transcription factor [Candidatus Nanopelagicales bacterium]